MSARRADMSLAFCSSLMRNPDEDRAYGKPEDAWGARCCEDRAMQRLALIEPRGV